MKPTDPQTAQDVLPNVEEARRQYVKIQARRPGVYDLIGPYARRLKKKGKR